MNSTKQRRNTTISKTDVELSFGNSSCPTVHSPVHPIKKSGSSVSVVSRIFSNRRLLLLWIIFASSFIGHSHDEPTLPQNQAVPKGAQVQLNCSAIEGKRGSWDYKNFLMEGLNPEQVYGGNNIYSQYAKLFSIDKSVKGYFNLVFNASEDTSGIYTCRPDIYVPKLGRAWVTVLDAQPACLMEVFPGFIKANCSIGFSGYWPPRLEWHNTRGTLEANDTHPIRNSKVTSSLLVPFNDNDPKASYTLTCTPKFNINDVPEGNTASNVPEFPASCTLTIGKSGEAPLVQTRTSSGVSYNVHSWHSLRLLLCLATLVVVELLIESISYFYDTV